jgi:hypothetical protein
VSEKESAGWTPSVGQGVKVVRDRSLFSGRTGIITRDDGKHAEPYYVEFDEGFGWYEAKDLQPAMDAEKGGES